jgi:hypothetical protein
MSRNVRQNRRKDRKKNNKKDRRIRNVKLIRNSVRLKTKKEE